MPVARRRTDSAARPPWPRGGFAILNRHPRIEMHFAPTPGPLPQLSAPRLQTSPDLGCPEPSPAHNPCPYRYGAWVGAGVGVHPTAYSTSVLATGPPWGEVARKTVPAASEAVLDGLRRADGDFSGGGCGGGAADGGGLRWKTGTPDGEARYGVGQEGGEGRVRRSRGASRPQAVRLARSPPRRREQGGAAAWRRGGGAGDGRRE